ncbi:MAG: hypothetical protein KGH53_00320 [Candidatus Micrarchaeota archaeon]|nr:hypothetical protein [Candidatus Micrarchaeota archaeon]
MAGKKVQSATEYILTYGWAFLIAAIVTASLYLFVFAPSTITQSSCSFYSGPYCQDIVLGSSNALSKIALLLTNTNPFPILNPLLNVNLSGYSPIIASCRPNFVLPGGAIICNATITPALSQGALASGKFILSYTPCAGGNVVYCSNNQRQNFAGTFSTHSSQLLSPTTITVSLSAQNYSQVALSTSLDKLTANVRLLGTPVSGATVNFTSNSINAPVNPIVTTTDGNGNAFSYISSSSSGNVLVTASFANTVANAVVAFTPPVCYTISIPSISGATSNAILIDGVGYLSFPQILCFGQGVSHSYSFQTTVSGAANVQYVYSFVTGCGATAQSGTLSGVANCTLTGNYMTQYFLTTSASPGIGGSVTPVSGWYNSGSGATLGETPNAGYVFNGWTGTGTGSYTGASTSPSVTLNNPITETGSFTSTTTSTTSTTSTSTTSTSSTSTTSTSTTSSTSTSTSTTTTIPANPTCGSYFGSITYSSTSTLTCNVVASGSININSGVTLDEHGYYLQANNTLTNSGTITDSYDGGAGGSAGQGAIGLCAGGGYPPTNGGAGLSGMSRTSKFLGVVLAAGAGGAGGGGGGLSDGCNSAANGGAGGNGGGIIELYGGNVVNNGVFTASGANGASGGSSGSDTSGLGGGGGGAGGNGGTIFLAYNSALTQGSTNVGGGGGGGGGAPNYPNSPPSSTYWSCQWLNGAGGGGGSNGGGGGGGGGTSSTGSPCIYNANGGGGGIGGSGACGGAGGAAGDTAHGISGTAGHSGCNGGASSAGQIITRVWIH